MGTTDADEMAEAMRQLYQSRLDAEARPLSGEHVQTLRSALVIADRVMRRVNSKGLPFAHRQELAEAIAAVDRAMPIVAVRQTQDGSA